MRLPPLADQHSRRALLALAPLLPFLSPVPNAAAKDILESRFTLSLPDGYAVSKRTATTGTT